MRLQPGLIGILLLGLAPAVLAAPRPLTISTLPFDNPAEQEAIFSLLQRQLATSLGQPVRFEAGKSYQEVIDRLGRGEIDVAFVGAMAYVQARKKGHARAILRTIRKGASTYHGVIVVPRDAAAKQLADLKGKRVAFVDAQSTSGFLFPRLLLRKAGVDPTKDITPVLAGGHRKVVELVAAKEVDAGACFAGASEVLTDPEAVRVLATTEPIPGDPVVARPGLGADLIKSVRTALIELAGKPEAEAFFSFAEIDGFVPAVDRDYDQLAELVRASY